MSIENSYTIIIPARYASTRLPAKPLLEISGKPLIQHVYESACNCQADKVYIATDDDRIKKIAEEAGATVIMTSGNHLSGTDRIAEAARIIGLEADDIIVNLQGDEYGMPGELLDQVASILIKHPSVKMATLCEKMDDQNEVNNPNVVKVVFSDQKYALYFSRSPVPYHNGQSCNYFRHIGLYAYRAGFLQAFTSMPVCELEQTESLEQLRVLNAGEKILVDIACMPTGKGIDTEQDLAEARKNVHS